MLRGHWLFSAGLIAILFSLGIRTTGTVTPDLVDGQLWLENRYFSDGDILLLNSQLWQNEPSATTAANLETQVPGQFNTYHLDVRGSQARSLGLLVKPHCGSAQFFVSPFPLATNQPIPIIELGKLPTPANILGQNASLIPQLVVLPTTQDYRLTINSYNAVLSPDSFCFDIQLGEVSRLYEFNNRHLVTIGLMIAVIFSIALYAFGMFFQSHNNAANLWLGLWASVAVMFFWSLERLWEIGFDVDFSVHQIVHYKIQYITLLLLGPLGVGYYRRAYETRFPSIIFTLNHLVTALVCIAAILISVAWWDAHLYLVFIYAASQFVIISGIMLKAMQEKRPDAMLSLLSVAPLFVAIPLDFLFDAGTLSEQSLSQYAWVFFMFIHCLIQSSRFSETMRKASKESQSLTIAVAQQTESLEEKNRQLLMVQSELHKANAELQALSITDGLSNAYNRLYFDRQFEAEWHRSRREQQAFSIILLDVDHFKKINDQYGHPAGDQAIKTIAKWLQLTFKRSQDIVCRYGGEEFAILLPNTTPSLALKSAEQLRQLIAETPVHYRDKEIYVTVSIGVSGTIPNPNFQPDDLLRVVDKALYSVKNAGRNGVCLQVLEAVPTSTS